MFFTWRSSTGMAIAKGSVPASIEAEMQRLRFMKPIHPGRLDVDRRL